MRARFVFAVCGVACAAGFGTLAAACGPFMPAPPAGDGYSYGGSKVPYRSERRGDGFDRAYVRVFGVGTVAGRDPGPRVGGTPNGYRYNEHRGAGGETLAPAEAAPPAASAEDAGAEGIMPSGVGEAGDGGVVPPAMGTSSGGTASDGGPDGGQR